MTAVQRVTNPRQLDAHTYGILQTVDTMEHAALVDTHFQRHRQRSEYNMDCFVLGHCATHRHTYHSKRGSHMCGADDESSILRGLGRAKRSSTQSSLIASHSASRSRSWGSGDPRSAGGGSGRRRPVEPQGRHACQSLELVSAIAAALVAAATPRSRCAAVAEGGAPWLQRSARRELLSVEATSHRAWASWSCRRAARGREAHRAIGAATHTRHANHCERTERAGAWFIFEVCKHLLGR